MKGLQILNTHSSLLRVAVLWHDTIVTDKLVKQSSTVTYGESSSCTLVLPASEVSSAKRAILFSPRKDEEGTVLHLKPGMKGEIYRKDRTIEVATLTDRDTLTIELSDSGFIDFGDWAIYFVFAGQREAIGHQGLWGALESSLLGSLLVALIAHLCFIISAFLLWEDNSTDMVTFDLSDRFLKIIAEEPPPEVPDIEIPEAVEDDPGSKAAGGEEGKFGEVDKTNETKVPKRDGELVNKIKDVGIHKALNSNLMGSGPLKNVFGGQQAFSDKLGAAMAGADGELVIGHGSGGLGLRGTGTGGGGTGFGRIHGMGRIDQGGTGKGVKAGLGGKTQKQKTRVARGKPQTSGFCKEANIQKVVSTRQGGIQYCYEKELARNPELQGKVTVSWRIGLDGKVQTVNIEESTLGNKEVEGCIRRNIERWVFEKPEGGMCQIRYPFVFSAGL